MKDSFGREIDYLRISVTDRCNLRCIYCMPGACDAVGSQEDILGSDEIVLIAEAAAETGIRHIRLTGGEPLIREDIIDLVSRIRKISGIDSVGITTNGILLEEYSERLASAGAGNINVSLDTLDEERFARITGIDENACKAGSIYDRYNPRKILDGIDTALRNGLTVRINCVLTDINRDEWADLCDLARDREIDVRFIELMPIGAGAGLEGISNRELAARIQERFGKMELQDGKRGNGPAVYYSLPGFRGCIGFISAVCDKFCSHCNRIRLTAAGILKPCLCYASTIDLKKMINSGADREELVNTIKNAILDKPAAHCFETPEMISESEYMSRIGG